MMRKDLWWPTGLIVTISGTILFFIWFIPFSASNMDSLVTEDYYEKGIKYQETIERINRTKTDGNLFLILPASELLIIQTHRSRVASIQGLISLKRPNSINMDKNIPISFTKNGLQKIDLAPGVWNLNILWNEGSVQYQQMKRVIVEGT